MRRIIYPILLVGTICQAQVDTLKVNKDKYIRINLDENISEYHISNPNDYFIEVKGKNIFIQALDEYAKESNLYIGTEHDNYYDFFVSYTNQLDKYTYNLDTNNSNQPRKGFNQVLEKNPLNGKKHSFINSRNVIYNNGIGLFIKGVYIKDENLYFLLEVENKTSIPYQIKEIKFFVIQDKELKNKALTEEEVLPEMIYDDVEEIGAKSRKYITVAFKKFTLSDRHLKINLLEKNGERNLNLPINNNLILKSKSL